MRLLEIENEYTLYVDMDGVLCDFDGGVKELLGEPINQNNKKLFWKKLKQMSESELVSHWANLDWTTQGKQLWNHVTKFNPIILSSPGTSMRSLIERGKTEWIEKHLSPAPSDIIYETEKEKYATPTSIIIDDRDKVLDPWRAAGGIGIKYIDGQLSNTLSELSKYLG